MVVLGGVLGGVLVVAVVEVSEVVVDGMLFVFCMVVVGVMLAIGDDDVLCSRVASMIVIVGFIKRSEYKR